MQNSIFYVSKLNSIAKNSSGLDSVIANYILLNISDYHKFTIDTIATDTNSSYATVCRFLKKLGVSGIIDLKKNIGQYLAAAENDSSLTSNFDMDLISSMSLEEIASNICNFSAGIVQHCHDAIDERMLFNVINILKKAKFIYFIGLGTSAITAKYAYTKFFRMAKPCSIDSDIIIAKMKASTLNKDSVLFAISSSGRTKTVVDVAKIAKKHNATVITLCDFAHSPLSKISDITLCTTTREANKHIDTDFPLIQGQVTLVDIIYLCYYKNFGESSSKSFNSTKAIVMDDKLTN